LFKVLVGPHSCRTVRIHAVWDERGEVRVELGEDEKRDVTDVFSVVQVWREPKP
jgi:hypothetical protein